MKNVVKTIINHPPNHHFYRWYGCKKFKKTRRRAHASSKAACPTQAPNTPWGYIALRPTAGVRYPGNSVGQMQPQKPWSRFKRERKIRGVKEWCRNKSHAQERRELSGLQPWGGRPAWRCTRSALARHSSEDSSGVLPLQSHGKALKQAVVLDAGRLIAPSRHSRGNGFEGLQGNRAPAPATSFSDNGQELQAFRPAAGQCVLVWALFDFVLSHSMLAVGGCLGQGPHRMPEVTARSKQPPIANPHISGAPPRASTTTIFRSTSVFWAGWEKTSFFDFGVEPSCLRSGSDQRPQAMVALCAVATTRANPGMVAVAVRHSVAHRAGASPKATWSRSRKRTIILKSGPATCNPRAGDGGACNHAPAPGCCSSWKCARKASRPGPAAVKREIRTLHCFNHIIPGMSPYKPNYTNGNTNSNGNLPLNVTSYYSNEYPSTFGYTSYNVRPPSYKLVYKTQ